ncbi:hypothetical protein [Klenkia soli]|uniref:hypothetical protein n=1 Tax=Klenkia soli TaxID=1052260 RepID=UPI0010420C46|nr:hypothetical protein [Klenkia soli]
MFDVAGEGPEKLVIIKPRCDPDSPCHVAVSVSVADQREQLVSGCIPGQLWDLQTAQDIRNRLPGHLLRHAWTALAAPRKCSVWRLLPVPNSGEELASC